MEIEQHEIYEYARKRVKQKKGLFTHFILLLLGSGFIYIANNALQLYPEIKWWTWTVAIWTFIFVLHFIKVFITDTFMNTKWERNQIDKLMKLQSDKINQLKSEIEDNQINQK